MQVFVIAVSTSIDAASVSIAIGIKEKATKKLALKIALYFGGFQALMPLIGFVAGSLISGSITSISKWIAFALLFLVGAKMLYESLKAGEDKTYLLSTKELLLLSVATSIDALIIGTAIKFLELSIILTAATIGLVTATICFCALIFAGAIGKSFGRYAETIAGIVLIVIAITFVL